MSIRVQVATGLKWQLIGVAGKQLLSMVVFMLLARLLGPAAFGLIALVGVFLGVINMFVDQGIGMALIQRPGLTLEHIHTAFWFNLACAVTLCLATVGAAPWIASLFHEPRLTPLLRWASLQLIIGALASIHTNLFIKSMDFRRPVIRNLLATSGGGIVGLAMALGGCGVWALIGQQLSAALVGTVFLWQASTYRPALTFSFARLRELFHVSFSVFASSMLWFFSSRLDQIVIGRFVGVQPLGLYAMAAKFPDFAKALANTPIAEVTLPALAKLQDDHVRMRRAICRGMELNALVAFAAYVGLAAVAGDLILFLLGQQWSGAGELCSLLSLYALILTLQVFFYPAMLAAGGAGKYLTLNIAQAVGVLIGCLVGIQFGVNYLVIGLIANTLLMSVPAMILLHRQIGLRARDYWTPCVVPALASGVMWVVVYAISCTLPSDGGRLLRLLCEVLGGGIVYLGVVFGMAPAILREFAISISHALRPPSPTSSVDQSIP